MLITQSNIAEATMPNKQNITSKNENMKKEEGYPQAKVSADNYAEPCSFNSNRGDEMQDWQAMKAEIDNLLQTNCEASVLLQKGRKVSDYWDKVRAKMRNR
jgi:hypothetical protein